MNTSQIIVIGLALNLWLIWYFWLAPKGQKQVALSAANVLRGKLIMK